ncbi:hypothetical protein COU05_01155 [bacterium (Candidatus Gribaldobacteria) CG10_big_fil_rev_8_21_14_0_10_37_21]|uniref:Fimbrial assembly protein n=1 Tax=bacterium (Candidatus Gribaldobacteria) CG10_big_fil_rev_8_21_14_0_10_37_21 TaxID=2014275 RepID=A0A2H0UUV0_9BACT|nr:MAG: hypothetical protein AUJ25_02955 [Parcubacteria group bacterium CG1_02_37_13]PIR90593.1 MAG: hypothetical protein COU05_01155 [bacterium (Candidatus Gribaldobacteria) CG10_big_fil_rev_8_21_14_0_10_37_21]
MFEKTQKDFKIIPQIKITSPKWLKVVFFGSFAPLIIVGIIYFYSLNQEEQLRAKKENLTAQIVALETNPENQEAKESFKDLSLRINDFGSLFDSHQSPSKFFQVIRNFCHKSIQLTSLNLNTKDLAATFSGVADNFTALSEQLLILKNQENIVNPKISGIKLGKDGKITFDLSLNFDPVILQKQEDE